MEETAPKVEEQNVIAENPAPADTAGVAGNTDAVPESKKEETPVAKSNESTEQPSKLSLKEAFNELSRDSEAVVEFKKKLHRYGTIDRFTWPDERIGTENIILQLKEKQVLVIKGVDSEWFSRAPYRMATVLQASLNRLWPGCAGVRRVRADEKLKFGFWKTFEKFDRPVIIVIPRISTSEFLRNFLLADWERAYYDFIDALRAINLFLVIQVADEDEDGELLGQKERHKLLKELYALWEVPALELELRSQKGRAGDELFKKIQDEFSRYEECHRQIYEIVKEENANSDDRILEVIRQEINTRNVESELMKEIYKDKSGLKLRLVYCGAFFNEVTTADFRKISEFLLKDQVEEIRAADGKLIESRPLKDIWSRHVELRTIISECKLAPKDMDGVKSIGFTRHISHLAMRNEFLRDYIAFEGYTQQLIDHNILFDANLTDRLYNALVRVLASFIDANHQTYDSDWLFNCALDEAYRLNALITDDRTRQMIELGERYYDISILKMALVPLEGLLKELLLSGKERLINMVKMFFEKLLGTRLDKKVALGLAIDLYKQLQDEGNFPEAELDRYFSRGLNEGTWQDKFDVYRLMSKNIYYKDLYAKTSRWLADASIGKQSWTKRFAWFHKLEYYISGFHMHFRLNKSDKKYEIIYGDTATGLHEDLALMIRELTSEECFEAWKHIFYGYDNLLASECSWLEECITGIPELVGREDEENCTELSLSADIFQNWFYVLQNETTEDEPGKAARQHEFVRLLTENVDGRLLWEIKEYWQRKIRRVYMDTIIVYKKSEDRKSAEEAIKKINNRSGSLKQLLELCRATTKAR